ncbi:MAG TPA: prolipoprotein diacylglyceryl transferase [Verrucomicrobiae bacterium]|nr:prolipoprotein diacylglyceryl transferase [Verrucomicrobiae bacterium]
MFGYWVHNLSPFALELAPGVGLRWYGLAYVGGLAIGWWLLRRWSREGWLPVPEGEIGDFMFWVAFMGIVVGGRLGYCFFYRLPSTLADPLSILRVWEGGMSSHGGIAGLWVAVWIYSRRKHLSLLRLADALALASPPGIFLGRLANFVNGELWGRPSWVPWAVIFPGSPMPGVPRHPSQLYEAVLEGLVLGAILFGVKRMTPRQGAVIGALMVVYPILRIIGECFREPDENIRYLWGGLTYGQVLSAGMLVLGSILLGRIWRTRGSGC